MVVPDSQLSSGGRPPPSLLPPRNRTFLQSWTAIPARTRLFISLSVCVFGGAGLVASDYYENKILSEQRKKIAQSISDPFI